jgi:hypothetical protein
MGLNRIAKIGYGLRHLFLIEMDLSLNQLSHLETVNFKQNI